MTTITIQNPPQAADWTRTAANAQHIEDFVNGSTPATLTTPGGSPRDNLAKVAQTVRDNYGSIRTQGAFATGTAYLERDVYTSGGIVYIVVIAHTSTSVSADLAAGKTAIYQGLTAAQVAASGGAALVGYGSRTVAGKLGESVSILDYLGAPDWNGTTGTDNRLMAIDAHTAAGDNVTLRFPFVAGAANQYYFGSGDWSAFSTMLIDADPGVSFVFADAGILYDGAGATTRFVRPVVATVLSPAPFSVVFGTKNKFRALVKDGFLSEAQFDRTQISAVLTNTTEVKQRQVAWPSGDSWSDDSIATTPDAKSMVYSSVASDGIFHCGLRAVAPGDELSISVESVTGSGTPQIVAMVRGTGGYGGVYFTTADNGSGTQVFRKDVGASAVYTDVVWPGKGTHSSYNPSKSLLTLRITSYTSFELLCNGVVLSSGLIAGQIFEAGFGIFGNAGANGVTLNNWTVARDKPVAGEGVANVLILGDSKTAPRTDSWPTYFREYLEGAAGLRVTSLNNYAIAGQNSAQQLSNLNTLGVPTTPYAPNLCIIDLGTNDQQGASGASGLISNIAAIVAKVRLTSATCKFVIASYSLWYTRTQAPGAGQNSVNYDIGGPYRAAIARYCAENGHQYVDLPASESFILSQFSGFQTPDLSFAEDLVHDNIHPSAYGARLRGWIYARAAAAALTPRPTLAQAWQTLAGSVFANGWTQFSTQPLRYRIDLDGFIHWEGIVNIGTVTDGTVVATIPLALLPEVGRDERPTFFFSNGTYARFELNPVSGQLKIYNKSAAGGSYFYVSSWSYKLNNGRP